MGHPGAVACPAMIARAGLAISRLFYRTCPDPFVIAVGLTVLTFGLAMWLGTFPAAGEPLSPADRALALLDVWRSDRGFWKLLAFGMQMCLVLVTGHALAAAPTVRRAIDRMAALPGGARSASAFVALAAGVAGLLNWGFGLVVGALLARAVGRSLARRGRASHYPLLAAAGYMGLLVFHGGLSASAPLSTTSRAQALKVLPESAVELLGAGVPLDRTLLSPLNLLVTGGLVIILPILFALLTPRAEQCQPPPDQVIHDLPLPQSQEQPHMKPATLPEWLDRLPVVTLVLAIPLLLAFLRSLWLVGPLSVGLNEVNMGMLAMGLLLHPSPRSYLAAVEDGARDCSGVILQFPIYAGVIGMMEASGLVGRMASGFAALGDARTMPVLSFWAATLVGLFVPSGGAQWGLQGEIALRSGIAAGVDPGTMIMSVAYGDELANMLQPFWALPLLAITGVKARDIVGYTAVAMLVAGAWMTLALALAA